MPASLYRPYFTPAEIDLLDHTDRQDLMSEINLIRVLIARVLEAAQHAKELTIKEHAAILSAFSHAGLTLARLARVQVEVHNPLDAVMKAIAEGERMARQQHHVFDYLSHTSSPSAA